LLNRNDLAELTLLEHLLLRHYILNIHLLTSILDGELLCLWLLRASAGQGREHGKRPLLCVSPLLLLSLARLTTCFNLNFKCFQNSK
jgi:hypothetical protein